ncbi:MAG: ATP synthase archaeal subunit H [Candidatus Methanoperedens sp.]|nr:ATP synthase archaeal subunit H [Candidatus Methanoperedens sp.]
MTRAEILSEIKKAEEEAKATVAKANESKNRKISDAAAQSREIVRKAEEDARSGADSEINEAKKVIKGEREKIVQKGVSDALDIKNKAKKNIDKAVTFILTEFERATDA